MLAIVLLAQTVVVVPTFPQRTVFWCMPLLLVFDAVLSSPRCRTHHSNRNGWNIPLGHRSRWRESFWGGGQPAGFLQLWTPCQGAFKPREPHSSEEGEVQPAIDFLQTRNPHRRVSVIAPPPNGRVHGVRFCLCNNGPKNGLNGSKMGCSDPKMIVQIGSHF